MPGPPIRKPSDHSPPAGSPRNIAGHHVLHRPLMPRHPPNAQKNKQQNTRQNQENCRRNLTVRCSRPLYSSQPTHPHPHPTTNRQQKHGPGNQGALPQNPDSMPPPHTHTRTHQGHPPQQTTTTTTAAAAHHKQACFLHHTTPQPTNPTHTAQGQPAAASVRDTPSRPAQTTPAQTKQTTKKEGGGKPPHTNLSLERR